MTAFMAVFFYLSGILFELQLIFMLQSCRINVDISRFFNRGYKYGSKLSLEEAL